MANPKRKTSKTRRDKRRTHYKAKAPKLVKCEVCGAMHQYHRVCPVCGSYRGKPVFQESEI